MKGRRLPFGLIALSVAGLVAAGFAAGAPPVKVGGAITAINAKGLKFNQKLIDKVVKLQDVGKSICRGACSSNQPKPPGWASILDWAIVALFVLVVLGGVVIPWLLRADWSRVRFRPASRLVELPDIVVTDETVERLHGALEGALADLDEDADPRQAVIGCWVRLEGALGETSGARGAAETSSELLVRTLSLLEVDADAIDELHWLYRRARYSTSPIGADVLPEARATLEATRDAIARYRAARGELVGVA